MAQAHLVNFGTDWKRPSEHGPRIWTSLRGRCESNEELRSLRAELGNSRDLALEAANLKGDCEALEIDNNNLRERLKMFELDLDGPADQRAGHGNHKQKIQYLVKLKDENEYYRSELAKKRHQLMRAEMNRSSYPYPGSASFDASQMCDSMLAGHKAVTPGGSADSSRRVSSGTPSASPSSELSSSRSSHCRRKLIR